MVRAELLNQGCGVEHAAQRDRLFLLPHAAQFCDLFVGADEEVRMYCEDARDFYCLLRWPRRLAMCNVVGPPLDPMAVLHCGARRGIDRLASLSGQARSLLLLAPAMGDQKAVETAQAVHQGLLMASGCWRDEEWLSYRLRQPGANLWCSAYIDDLGVLSVEKASAPVVEGPGADVHRRCLAAYHRGGFVLHEGKSQVGVTEAIVWGGRISSSRRTVSADYGKLGPLVVLTCRVLRLGSITPRIAQKLVGPWVHVLMFRRSMFAFLD